MVFVTQGAIYEPNEMEKITVRPNWICCKDMQSLLWQIICFQYSLWILGMNSWGILSSFWVDYADPLNLQKYL